MKLWLNSIIISLICLIIAVNISKSQHLDIYSFYGNNLYIPSIINIDDDIWFTTYLNGVRKLNLITNSFVEYIDEIPNYKNIVLTGNAKDAENNLWLSSDKGLLRYQNNKFEEIQPLGVTLLYNSITSLKSDSKGKLWACSSFMQILSFENNVWSNHDLFSENTNYYITKMIIDNNDNLVLWVNEIGLVIYDGQTQKTYSEFHDTINENYVVDIQIDNNNTIYVIDSRLNIYYLKDNQILSLANSIIDSGNYMFWVSSSFDKNNKLLIGVNGLNIYDGTKWTIINRKNSDLTDTYFSKIYSINTIITGCLENLQKYLKWKMTKFSKLIQTDLGCTEVLLVR
ncbi:hypothetical protein MASR1M45_17520 [Candidatus Kapaibacterium sp.]